MRRMDPRLLALMIALPAALAAACTSEASLGYWKERRHPSATPSNDQADGAIDPAAGAGGAAVSDASMMVVQTISPLCLRNPSLDGFFPNVGPIDSGTWWPAEAWDVCFNDPEDFPDPQMRDRVVICSVAVVNDQTKVDNKDGLGARMGVLPAPTHGVGYLQLDSLRDLPERTSQMMCAELKAGVTYNFAVDLASRVGETYEGRTLQGGVLEIFASNTLCSHSGEPIWRSPKLTKAWQTHCVSITPSFDASIMTLQVPVIPFAPAAILVDNIRLDPSCGPAVITPD